MLLLTYFLVQLCSFTLSSKLECVTDPQVRINDHQLMVYFEGIKTIYFVNQPLGSESYVKYFHVQWNVPVIMNSYVDLTKINDQSQTPRKHSDSEGYVIFIKGQKQFVSTLRMVQRSNPLARCLFFYPQATVEKVAQLHKLAWKLFGLVNVVIVFPLSDLQQYWSLFNPFNGEHHNMENMIDARLYLRNMHDFKNLQEYPIRLKKSSKTHGLNLIGIHIMQTMKPHMNFSVQLTSKDSEINDVDPQPQLMQELANKNIVFLHPLTQCKLLFAVPKNRKQIGGRLRFKESLKIQLQLLIVSYFIILLLFGRFYQKLYGSSRETETSYLLLASAGILLNVSLVSFKKLRYVAVTIMFAHVGFNAYFQGMLFEIASIPNNHDINTLDHLLKTNLQLVTTQPIYDSLSGVSGNARIQLIKKRLNVIYMSKVQSMEAFSNNTHGMLQIDNKVHYFAQTMYDDQGNDLVHVVPASVHEFYQAITARRDLPFLRRFNELIGQMIETGIVQQKFSQAMASMELKRLERVKRGKTAPDSTASAEVINLNEVIRSVKSHKAFFVGGFIAFLGELFYYKFGKRMEKTAGEIGLWIACRCYEILWALIITFKNVSRVKFRFFKRGSKG